MKQLTDVISKYHWTSYTLFTLVLGVPISLNSSLKTRIVAPALMVALYARQVATLLMDITVI